MTRALRLVTHNWPLKLGAIALATLLYGGLVVSQATEVFPGSVQIGVDHPGTNVIVMSQLGSVGRIRYVAPPDLGLRIDSDSFRASVDLAGIVPSGGPVSLDVTVVAVAARNASRTWGVIRQFIGREASCADRQSPSASEAFLEMF